MTIILTNGSTGKPQEFGSQTHEQFYISKSTFYHFLKNPDFSRKKNVLGQLSYLIDLKNVICCLLYSLNLIANYFSFQT